MNEFRTRIQTSYDRVAEEYAERFLGELDHKPLDRALLDAFATSVRGRGLVIDVGCGPGQTTRYLRDRGVTVEGVDLSPGMVAVARRFHPDLQFRTGDMAALPYEEGACAGLLAFYAIVNLPPQELESICREFRRVLRPDGRALLSFHVGDEQVHVDDFLGKNVALDFWFYPVQTVEHALHEAGFEIEARLERTPYPDVEYPSRRAYLLAGPMKLER